MDLSSRQEIVQNLLFFFLWFTLVLCCPPSESTYQHVLYDSTFIAAFQAFHTLCQQRVSSQFQLQLPMRISEPIIRIVQYAMSNACTLRYNTEALQAYALILTLLQSFSAE